MNSRNRTDWLSNLEVNRSYLFSFLFIDRAGSTTDHENFRPLQVQNRSKIFHEIVEEAVAAFGEMSPSWLGDATAAFFCVHDNSPVLARAKLLAKSAFNAAIRIRERLAGLEEMKAYIALHLGNLLFEKELGKIKNVDLDITGHMLKICPADSILAHREFWLLLATKDRQKFKYFGTTNKDNVEAFIYPLQRLRDEHRKNDFVSQTRDRYSSKQAYLDFLKVRHGTLSARGLRQEHLVSLPLMDIFQPVALRRSKSAQPEIDLTDADHYEATPPVELTAVLSEGQHIRCPWLSGFRQKHACKMANG